MASALVANRMRAWGFVDAADPKSAESLAKLEEQLRHFYRNEAEQSQYWHLAEESNRVWLPETHPFHTHLASLIPAGATVIDFGCGTAHAVRNLKQGVRYIGVEGSPTQVEANRERYPDQTFIQGDMTQDLGLSGQADWAVSFFAIEHCVRPDLMLRRMVESCKPGGHIAILCPNFRVGLTSARSGSSALGKREKLRRLRLFDLISTVVEERWFWPKRIRTVHQALAFPIYLRPRCLGTAYYCDSDAVYLATEERLSQFLTSLGCDVDPVTREAKMPELREVIIYQIAKKRA